MNRSPRSASREAKDQDKGRQNGKSPRDSRSNSPRKSPRRSRSASPGNKGNVLYVGNLSRRIDETDLREIFDKYGRISDVNIVKDPYTNECRGFAFVKFESSDSATDALEAEGKEIDGRKIRIEKSKKERGHPKTPGEYLGHKGRRGRRSPSPRYRRRSPRGRRSRDRRSRERSDRYRDDRRDRHRSRSRSRSRDRYRRSRDRSDSPRRRR